MRKSVKSVDLGYSDNLSLGPSEQAEIEFPSLKMMRRHDSLK
jgi:hypothetical protein